MNTGTTSMIMPLPWYQILGAVKKFPESVDIDGFVHHEFVPPGQSVTGHFYEQVLHWLSKIRPVRRTNNLTAICERNV
jgi:hypothetical protein